MKKDSNKTKNMTGEALKADLTAGTSYQSLLGGIGHELEAARQHMASMVNGTMVATYWHVGRHIVEYEQQGNERADYGSQLLRRLAADLTRLYGSGFNKSNVYNMRRLYLTFPIFQTASGKSSARGLQLSTALSWSHYLELLQLNNELEMSFYQHQAIRERWSVRELRRQMSSMLFHRLAACKDKEAVMRLAAKGAEIEKPADLVHDPYVLEFVGLPENRNYDETDLENALVSNLSAFMLELGRGFAYVGRQYRFSISGRHYHVDLVFYNVPLKCYVLIDLKRGRVQHEDIGQMNFYLNYFRHEVNGEGDNEPIGIVLGASADRLTMEYAMEGISAQLFVSRYQLYLPDRETLERRLRLSLDKHVTNGDGSETKNSASNKFPK